MPEQAQSAILEPDSGQMASFICNLALTKLVSGHWVLQQAACQFSVRWNRATNTGSAILLSIDEVPVSILLHSIGLPGKLDFMSDMPSTIYRIANKDVLIDRVILSMEPNFSHQAAVILFKKGGSTIQASANYANDDLLNQFR